MTADKKYYILCFLYQFSVDLMQWARQLLIQHVEQVFHHPRLQFHFWKMFPHFFHFWKAHFAEKTSNHNTM